MAGRITSFLAVVMILAPAAWAESPRTPAADCGEEAFLASLAAPRVPLGGPSLDSLDPLRDARFADANCCTQQEVYDCYDSVEPGSGCYVERITCWYNNECWCQIFCN